MLVFNTITQTTIRYNYLHKANVKRQIAQAFGIGAGSVMSIQGSYIPTPIIPSSRDRQAIAAGWKRVGESLRNAARKLRK